MSAETTLTGPTPTCGVVTKRLRCTSSPLTCTINHPTDAERFLFDTNGYLVLEDFLPESLVDALNAALERTISAAPRPRG